MSEDEGFLRRWSRRKQAALRAERTDLEPEADAPPVQPADDALPEATIDLSTLPPVESIGPGTDIRAFLQKGVPVDLTRAALRRVWSEDPAIRDFIEVAENQWDFAAGTDIPGFGPLDAGADLQRMVADIMGDYGDAASRAAKTDLGRIGERTSMPSVGEGARDESGHDAGDPPRLEGDRQELSASVESDDRESESALQQVQEAERPQPQAPGRRHGGALPQ